MAVAMANNQKNWADDDEEESHMQESTETVDKDGIITRVDYKLDDQGRKIKVTRRIRKIIKKVLVDPSVAERRTWAKFGADKGVAPGPQRANTIVTDAMNFKIGFISKTNKGDEEENATNNKPVPIKTIQCRICKLDHFTSRCPYKETLGNLDEANLEDAPPADDAGASGTGSKYVPPSMRAGAKGGAGESMFGNRNRDDLPTLRITNVSQDAEEDDLYKLFKRFGAVNRVFIGRDRETNIGKGFAFITFDSKADAERAMVGMEGYGYDNLILHCQWSLPREERKM